MSMDYTKPLLVPAGSDALGQIGNGKKISTSYTTTLHSAFTHYRSAIFVCRGDKQDQCKVSLFIH